MKLPIKKYGNSWIIIVPKEYRDLEYLWVYPKEQLSDSEKLDYLYKLFSHQKIPKKYISLKQRD